jgi:hypothetical protein
MATDPRDFLINSDYEMDKIVYFTTGTITAGSSDTIAHNLSFTPMVFGVFATDSDFTDTHVLPFSAHDGEAFTLSADNTNVNIAYDNQDPTASVYYCIMGFEPDGSTADAPATSQYAGSLIIDTEYNYCKLYSNGYVNGDADTTITHDLGYLPQIMAWTELNGEYEPTNTSNIEITTTDINFNYAGAGYDKVHYRIYYDETI